MKLTNEDKDDLQKYARHFALKAAQIIVSSRQKEKKSTPCRQKPDWFNLNIAALAEADVNTIRKTISNKFCGGVPVCVEIYAESSEGQLLVETWCIRLSPEYSDPSPKITTFNVYNQIGILLKSLLSVTRVLPAYKLTFHPNETCVMRYQIFEGETDFDSGLICKHISIGRIFTPIGTLQLTVDYNPNIVIQSNKKRATAEGSMFYESHHFSLDSESNSKFAKNCQGNDKLGRYTIPFAEEHYPTPTKKVIPALRPGGVSWYPKSYHEKFSEEKPNAVGDGEENTQVTKSIENLNKTEPDSPSDSLAIREIDLEDSCQEELSESGKSYSSEYVMSIISKCRSKSVPKSICYPFASGTPESEISNFYRECSNPPTLVSLKESSSVKDIDVTQQLNAFEEKIKEFDELVKSLSASPDSDN